MVDLKKELQDFIAQCHPAVFERIEYMESRNLFFPKSEYWESMLVRSVCNEIDFGWKMWQLAKAQVVPEGFVLMPKEPTDEIIEAMNEFDYRNDYSDMDGAYRTIVETLEKAQEDAELNAICDSRKDQKRISVNIDDL